MKKKRRALATIKEPIESLTRRIVVWQISFHLLVLLDLLSRCSASFGLWTAYDVQPNTPPRHFCGDVFVLGLRNVQAGEVLNGLLLYAPCPGGVVGHYVAIFGFVHGSGL
jgi:hypothetical protein